METSPSKINSQKSGVCDKELYGFGRRLSHLEYNNISLTAVQMECNRKSSLLIKLSTDKKSKKLIYAQGAEYNQLVLAASEDSILIAWNQFKQGKWSICAAGIEVDNGLKLAGEELVFTSTSLIYQPAICVHQGDYYLVWAGMTGGNLRIHYAVRKGGVWSKPEVISDAGIDAFRPVTTSNGEDVFIVWDQYCKLKYEIATVRLSQDSQSNVLTIGSHGERWFCPTLTATVGNQPFLAWIVMQEVVDNERGIVDHFPFAMLGCIQDNNEISIITDPDNSIDSRIAADMREGLLAVNTYKGYLGCRRRIQLTVSPENKLFCLWEVCREAEGSVTKGWLAAREWDKISGWSKTKFIANSGYGYTVAPYFHKKQISISFFNYDAKGSDIVTSGKYCLTAGETGDNNPEKWRHWEKLQKPPAMQKKRKSIVISDTKYKMYWADTHCHSNFSPDAEGEVDEIIHYARDFAKLDALCVLDNDYYPHKFLTEAEWQIHQELASHYTEPDKFVLFPGYEFTFHKPGLSADFDNRSFNHRSVIYPRPGGHVLRRTDQESNTDHKLVQTLSSTPAMAYPHHCTYTLLEPKVEWNVEICSSWRVVMAESDFSLRQLLAGHKFGFIGSSDAHRANPGLGGAMTGIYATDLSPESLFEAYRKRRIVASQGFPVFIDFRIGDLFIGEEGELYESPLIKGEISAPDSIEKIEVLRNGQCIKEFSPCSSDFKFEFVDKDIMNDKEKFYYLVLKLVGENGCNFDPGMNSELPFTKDSRYPHNLAKARGVFAWTSPIWVKIIQ